MASRFGEQEVDEDEEKMYYAISCDAPAHLQVLIRNGIDVNMKFRGSNQLDKSALHLCCEMGRLACAELLLKARAWTSPKDAWNQTPLMYSVSTERDDMVQLLVKNRCNIKVKDRYGRTALHYAVNNVELGCMKALLDGKVDINVQDDVGRTALWLAVSEDGHAAAAKCLIDAGCDINTTDKREKTTPLHTAIVRAKKDMLLYMQLLLDVGDLTNTVDMIGVSPMTTLIRLGQSDGNNVKPEHLKAARLLLAGGLHVDLAIWGPYSAQHFHGTPMKAAVERGSVPFVQLLLSAGADPDLHDSQVITPIVQAAYHNHMEVAKLLLRANCRLDVRGLVKFDGFRRPVSAFTCAVLRGHFELAELLVLAGYRLKHESYLLTNQDVPDRLVKNCDLWCWAREQLERPQPLVVLCRDTLRGMFGRKVAECVPQLPLPEKLKDLLLLRDLIG